MQGTLKFTVRKRAIGPKVTSAQDAFAYLRGIAEFAQEAFVVLLLTAKNQVLGQEIVGLGSSTATVATPAQVFTPALLAGAVAVVLAHNHPSGVATPSREDFDVTTRMVQAGNLLGVRVLDHLIIGDDGFYSFAENGYT